MRTVAQLTWFMATENSLINPPFSITQFSDLLLLCTPRLMGGRVISGPQYRLRAKYRVDHLEILEGDNLETAHSFYIRDNDKTVELYTQ